MSSVRSTRALAASISRSAASPARRPATTRALMVLRKPTKIINGQQFFRPISTSQQLYREASEAPNPSGIAPTKTYNYQEVSDIAGSPSSNQILIDVREPSELLATGRIPGAKSVPISSAPDAFFMSPEDFEAKFSFQRPGENDEVIFYCKAGVRSRQAALLAAQARPMFGGKHANYPGSWLDWEKNGGKAEKEGEQGEQASVSGVTDPGQGRP